MLRKCGSDTAIKLFNAIEAIRKSKGLSRIKTAPSIGVDERTIRDMRDGHVTEKTMTLVAAWIKRNQAQTVPAPETLA